VASRIQVARFVDIENEQKLLAAAAWSNRKPIQQGGLLKFVDGGEYHAYNPDVVNTLQAAVQQGDYEKFKEYTALVHQRGVFLELLVVALLHGSLQGIHHIRVVGVVFAAIDELQQAALLDRLAVAPGRGGQELLLVLDIDEARNLDAAGD
ncbi:hypothetical protein LJG06_32855, partial [Pseudomonas aeruginosa]|uniref:hypothetical protein n=1 Tax=Pseudomonas aeruginosa TaxID=287 RepID=UPI001D0A43E4